MDCSLAVLPTSKLLRTRRAQSKCNTSERKCGDTTDVPNAARSAQLCLKCIRAEPTIKNPPAAAAESEETDIPRRFACSTMAPVASIDKIGGIAVCTPSISAPTPRAVVAHMAASDKTGSSSGQASRPTKPGSEAPSAITTVAAAASSGTGRSDRVSAASGDSCSSLGARNVSRTKPASTSACAALVARCGPRPSSAAKPHQPPSTSSTMVRILRQPTARPRSRRRPRFTSSPASAGASSTRLSSRLGTRSAALLPSDPARQQKSSSKQR
eukprot:scaffold268969_cov32-Tisochrysis_lutea.AAC.1